MYKQVPRLQVASIKTSLKITSYKNCKQVWKFKLQVYIYKSEGYKLQELQTKQVWFKSNATSCKNYKQVWWWQVAKKSNESWGLWDTKTTKEVWGDTKMQNVGQVIGGVTIFKAAS